MSFRYKIKRKNACCFFRRTEGSKEEKLVGILEIEKVMKSVEELKEEIKKVEKELKEQFSQLRQEMNERFDQIEKRLDSLEKQQKDTEIDIEFLTGKVGVNEMVLNRFK
ncbi:hypothetical protein J8N01_26015 [Priestia megaterium]|uniref:hypothetical protein n=1 Tax=Priestia megaterium TaxID=1404 RepID=UPI002379EE5C|nr:hypothetical protein [Priestia megaterium]WDM33697.1 hypothetical protein J8N01_26015 [Priestia megaterium]